MMIAENNKGRRNYLKGLIGPADGVTHPINDTLMATVVVFFGVEL